MNQIINMIVRQVMHQLIRRGVSAGFDHMDQRRRGGDTSDQTDPQAQQDMTPEERRQMRQARQQARRQRQQMKAVRKVTRF